MKTYADAQLRSSQMFIDQAILKQISAPAERNVSLRIIAKRSRHATSTEPED